MVVSHPDPSSFTMAVARSYAETVEALGQVAVIRDLYRMNFQPVLNLAEIPGPHFQMSPDVAAELEVIGKPDVLVLVYPIWFGGAPAMIKGYVERVLGANFAVGTIHDDKTQSRLAGCRLLSLTVSGMTENWLEERGLVRGPRVVFDDYLRRSFAMQSSRHVQFGGVNERLSERVAQEHFFLVQQAARKICEELV